MESSLNSSSPEPTVSGVKSIFNKPTNVSRAFEVSINESVTAAPSNKSDLDITSSDGNELFPFKKSRKSTQQDFNVTFDDSNLNNVCEQSVTFAKPQPVFSKRQKSLIDFFNVSYNETNGSSLADTISKSIDESNAFVQTNPFKRVNKSQNELSVRNESSIQVTSDKNNEDIGLDESQKPTSTTGVEDEVESTVYVTKENPFKKRNVQDLSNQIEVSFTERNETAELVSETVPGSRPNDESESDVATKSNPFKRNELSQNNSISITEERSNMSNVKKMSNVLTDPNQTPKNISLDRSISKLTNNSTSYLEQSSINDDNLNNWMSDQSDEEMPPPTVPSVTANLSPTKEKPPSPEPPTETNPLSIWEKKLSEIVSNVERKSQALKTKMNSPQKPNPFKKSDQNVEKPVDVNKSKPLKLIKPAPFATKKLYNYIAKRLKPKYGIDTMLEAENLVISICDTVKKVTRRKTHQKGLIQNLKKEMAEAGLIETTMDFYEFVIKFLPYDFRVKVVPCVQPVTNVVYPPKDALVYEYNGINPLDMFGVEEEVTQENYCFSKIL